VQAIFRNWDANGAGVITEAELKGVLMKVGVLENDVRVLLDYSGLNVDGHIRYEEFFGWLFNSSFNSGDVHSPTAPGETLDCGSDASEAEVVSDSLPSTRPTLDAQSHDAISALQRLMQEFVHVQGMLSPRAGPIVSCSLIDDSLADWHLELKFDEDTVLQHGLEDYAQAQLNEVTPHVELQVKFLPDYPHAPPEFWIRRPRLQYLSAPVSFGGKVCMSALTTTGWKPSMTLRDIILELHGDLLARGAKVDVATSAITSYGVAPTELNRLSTRRFPTVNHFSRWFFAMSAKEAAPFLGDAASVESTDKISLPFQFASSIYEQPDVSLPLMFELKTPTGRKTHCGIFEFMYGLPPTHVLMPQWVMDDLFLGEGQRVQVRCVRLDLITKVKVQPHTIEFYEAVREAGGDVAGLLTMNLKRLSALTEGTSVPIVLGPNRRLLVEIVELEPSSAVRVVDSNVTEDFEFKVDFDPAPDFEDDEACRKRQDRVIAHLKQRKEEEERRQHAAEQRQQSRKRTAFEERRELLSEVREVEGVEQVRSPDLVGIGFRLPNGERLAATFRRASPVSALIGFVMRSKWATEIMPWDVVLSQSYPKKKLCLEDVVTPAMHKSLLFVTEVPAPEGAFDEPGGEPGIPASFDESSDGAQGAGGVCDDTPKAGAESERDWEYCFEQTRRAFERQRAMQERALPVQAGRFVGAPAEEVYESEPVNEPSEEEKAAMIERLVAFSGASEDGARTLLSAHRWDVDLAVNSFLDRGGLDNPTTEAGGVFATQLIDQVVGFSGASPEAAREALENAGWDVSRALNAVLDM